jgi:hypothetical protein
MDRELITQTRADRRLHRRDERTRQAARRLLQRAPHLDDPRFAPLVRNFLQLTFVLERVYQRLAKVDDLISPRTGELRNSVDVFRRLSEAHRQLCVELQLSPGTARPGLMDLAGKIADAEK